MTGWFETLVQSGFVFMVCYAVLSDVTRLRVPNAVPVALVALFLLHGLVQQAPGVLATHVLVGAGALAAALFLYTRGAFGGGDAKFLAALALWMGPAHITGFAVPAALLGGVTAVGLLGLKKLLVARPALESRAVIAKPVAWARAGRMPYALPLGLSALIMRPRLF